MNASYSRRHLVVPSFPRDKSDWSSRDVSHFPVRVVLLPMFFAILKMLLSSRIECLIMLDIEGYGLVKIGINMGFYLFSFPILILLAEL